MSALEAPSKPNSKEAGDAVSHIRDVIHSQLGIAQALIADGDCIAAARVSEIVGTRGCRLSACAIAATVRQTGNDKPDGDKVIFGLDGSLVEFYPRFEQRVRDALVELLGEEVEKRVSIVMAKDGSGVGGELLFLSSFPTVAAAPSEEPLADRSVTRVLPPAAALCAQAAKVMEEKGAGTTVQN